AVAAEAKRGRRDRDGDLAARDALYRNQAHSRSEEGALATARRPTQTAACTAIQHSGLSHGLQSAQSLEEKRHEETYLCGSCDSRDISARDRAWSERQCENERSQNTGHIEILRHHRLGNLRRLCRDPRGSVLVPSPDRPPGATRSR